MKPNSRYGRRAFLGGATVLIGLPFLETLAPKPARGQSTGAPKRFLGYFYPNGMVMDAWRPMDVDGDLILGPSMGPAITFDDGLPIAFPESEQGPGLDQLKEHILILSGLQNTKQEPGTGDHSGGVGAFLTNRTTPRSSDATSMGGPSIDFVISQAIGQSTRRPYLAIAGEQARPAGSTCDTGFSCAVGDHISFDADGRNLPRYDHPEDIFDQLFSGLDASSGVDALKQRWAQDQSVLDVIAAEAEALKPALSYQDKPRLEEYLTSVREVERRVGNLQSGGGGACTLPERTTTYSFENGRVTIDTEHELMALALQCDATRVISYMWGNSSNGRPHTFIGAPGGHHDISHHGGRAENLNKLRRIDYWWFRRFAELLLRLKSLPDIDGRTVLDNTLVFLGTDVSDGDEHNHDDMPVVLAGGGAGFTMGRHVQYQGNWFGELFVAIANGLGAPIPSFGEKGTAPLPGLIT
jgi:hypothetical protein